MNSKLQAPNSKRANASDLAAPPCPFGVRSSELGVAPSPYRVGVEPSRATTQDGFTLVEVLVAIAILAFSLMAVIAARNQSVREIGRALEFSDAWVLGMRKMGEVETEETLDEGSDGGGFEDNSKYLWVVTKTKYEVDIAGQYFPGQDRATIAHKPKELLRIELTLSLVQPPPDRPPEVFRLVAFTKKRRFGQPVP